MISLYITLFISYMQNWFWQDLKLQTFLDIKNGKEKFNQKLTLREKLWQEIGYEMAGLERNWGPDINTPTRV